jgi:hypothetical protein
MPDATLDSDLELAEAAKAFGEIAQLSFAADQMNASRGSTLLPATVAGALLAPTFYEPSFRAAVDRVLAARLR